jgi:hypothetical protein
MRSRKTMNNKITPSVANKIENLITSVKAATVLTEIPNLLTPQATATALGVSTKWLSYKRWAGGGPSFIKLAGKVRYPEDCVLSYYGSLELQNSTTKKESSLKGGK